jgi:hypothetical protein
VSQIEESPEDTLLRVIVSNWYRDRVCSFCRRPVGMVAWHDRMPALRAPDGTLVEWSSIPTENAPAVLESHEPVCWNCNLTESFRREHPELVTDRAETPLRERAIH